MVMAMPPTGRLEQQREKQNCSPSMVRAFSRHPLTGRVEPCGGAASVGGAKADPDFLAGGEVVEYEEAFLADGGVLPDGVGEIGRF